MRNPTVIFRVTNNCNLKCKYCYDKSNEVENKFVNQIFAENMDVIIENLNKIYTNENAMKKIIFHGGEPLLVKPKTYEEFITKMNEKFKDVIYSIQTNGTLINDEYAQLLKKYKISVGISLDGCDEEQNGCRVYGNGKNSFSDVMKAIEVLKKNDVRYGIIITLTKKHIGQAKRIYDFLAINHISADIRPAFPTKNNDNSIIMTQEEYEKFFIELFEIWYNDSEKRVSLRQISEIYQEFSKIIEPNYKTKLCCDSKSCFANFYSLDVNGNVYACNRTYNNPDLKFGNLNENTFEEIRNKALELKRKRIEYIEKSDCKQCPIFEYCNGGCPANSIEFSNNMFEPNKNWCKARINIHNYIKNKMINDGNLEFYIENRKKKENENS